MGRVILVASVLLSNWCLAASTEFERLKELAGQWTATTSSGKSFRVTYGLTSANTVLLETYGSGSGHETISVFHADGPSLIVTHYCAQGNQPRLRLNSSATRHWVFTFADVTNLADPKASHLVRLELQLSPDGMHLTRTETYRENGRDEATALELHRSS